MVIIQPSGGLCNRMRVINSSLELAKRKGAKLLVLWYCADELNAPFESLFEPVDEFQVINFSSLKDIKSVDGLLNANFSLKGDLNKIKSNGFIKISKASLLADGIMILVALPSAAFSNASRLLRVMTELLGEASFKSLRPSAVAF